MFAPLHRDEAAARLRVHLADYAKGQGSHWAVTRVRVKAAMQRAQALVGAGHAPADGTQPYTNMHEGEPTTALEGSGGVMLQARRAERSDQRRLSARTT